MDGLQVTSFQMGQHLVQEKDQIVTQVPPCVALRSRTVAASQGCVGGGSGGKGMWGWTL